MIKLRPYQEKSIEGLRSCMRKNPHGNFIFQSPTGTGKTVTFSFMATEAVKKGKKVAIFSNRIELMNQAGGAFEKWGINPDYLKPNKKTPSSDVQCVSAMMQTMKRRINKPDAIEFLKSRDLIIADEIHVSDFDKIIQSGIIDHVPVIGASATPLRMGNQLQLGMIWDEIVLGEQVKYFVENGWLMPDRYFGIDAGDVSGIEIDSSTGDYNPYQMYKHFDKREKYAGVIDNYRSHSDGNNALTFCSNQAHAIKTAIEFNKAGINTMFLVSGISEPKKPLEWNGDGERIKYEIALENYMLYQQYKHLTGNRKTLLKDLQSGKLTNLVNVAMLTTGVDIPNLRTVIIDRYTLSLSLYLQIIGRGSRPHPESGKINFCVLDMGNAAHRKEHPLGRYMQDRDWGLWHLTLKGGGIAGTKLCDKNKEDKNKRRGCNRLVHIGAKMCKCGFIFATEKELKEAELREIAYADQIPEEVLISTMNPKQLQAHAKLKGYKIGWIGRVLHGRGGADEVYSGLGELGYNKYWIKNYVLKFIK